MNYRRHIMNPVLDTQVGRNYSSAIGRLLSELNKADVTWRPTTRCGGYWARIDYVLGEVRFVVHPRKLIIYLEFEDKEHHFDVEVPMGFFEFVEVMCMQRMREELSQKMVENTMHLETAISMLRNDIPEMPF